MDQLGVNQNRTRVRYGDPKDTEEDATSTATWSVRVFKFEQTEEEEEKTVDGAHFQILKDGKPLKFIYLDDGRYRFNSSDEVQHAAKSETTGGAIRKSEPTEHGYVVVDTLTTKKGTGILWVTGLDSDSYYLKETYAPTGYNQEAGEVLFHIVGANEASDGEPQQILYGMDSLVVAETAGTVCYRSIGSTKAVANEFDAAGRVDEGQKLGNMIPFENKTSTSLPKVGGMGTTILYIIGGILVVGAGAYLFFSSKSKKEKK
ncbi:MAG: SpaA isopeptide-forming pilin-related protein [bacterium]